MGDFTWGADAEVLVRNDDIELSYSTRDALRYVKQRGNFDTYDDVVREMAVRYMEAEERELEKRRERLEGDGDLDEVDG